jgi:hypothetical protein
MINLTCLIQALKSKEKRLYLQVFNLDQVDPFLFSHVLGSPSPEKAVFGS